MTAPKILFLQQEDVIAAGVLDMAQTLKDVEQALTMLGRGEIKNPPKTSLKLYNEDGSWRSMLNCMPVYIGGSIDRPGVKWASESSLNIKTQELPMGIDILILSDPNTVLPVAIMDATLITAMRTAANAIMAVKYLAADSARKLAVVGAGVIGRSLLMALKALGRKFEEVRLCDLRREKAEALAREFESDLPMRVVADAEAAIRGSDIAITATTAKRRIVDMDWLDTCTLAVQVAANEFPAEAILKADKVTLDDWEQSIHNEGSTFQELYDKGEIKREDVTILCDIIAGKEPGRTSEEQRILHMSRGLGCLDVMVAERIYQTARRLNLGQELKLWNAPRWI